MRADAGYGPAVANATGRKRSSSFPFGRPVNGRSGRERGSRSVVGSARLLWGRGRQLWVDMSAVRYQQPTATAGRGFVIRSVRVRRRLSMMQGKNQEPVAATAWPVENLKLIRGEGAETIVALVSTLKLSLVRARTAALRFPCKFILVYKY